MWSEFTKLPPAKANDQHFEAGPVKSCQTLVKKEDISNREAAATAGMNAPRTPMETVGNPIPVAP